MKQLRAGARRLPRFFRIWYLGLAVWLVTTAMHIPDGYLSPATSAVLFALVLPFWAAGIRRLRRTANAKNIPVIALAAAFSFVLMMFNVPLPGGTSGHAVGGALAAVVLGPDVATIAITTALVIQALFFGDGGILALGANSFNMAVVLPYVGYAVYQAAAGRRPDGSRRQAIAAAAGGWAGLTAAAFVAGVEFGLQPLLFHAADGTPLYAPYPLAVSIPAMVVPHALVASVVEGLVTGLAVVYLQRAHPEALAAGRAGQSAGGGKTTRSWRAQWAALAALAAATPLGLLAPGTAWGEWGSQELARQGLGFVPRGLAQMAGLWGAPLAGYSLPGLGRASLGYILSALVGVLLIALLAGLFSALAGRSEPGEAPGDA